MSAPRPADEEADEEPESTTAVYIAFVIGLKFTAMSIVGAGMQYRN